MDTENINPKVTVPKTTPSSNPDGNLKLPKVKLLHIIIASCVLILLGGYFLYRYQSKISLPAKSSTQKPPISDPNNPIIAKVGEEYIYQNDLNREITSYPPIKNMDVKKFLLEKMASDSAILQGGQADGLIKLDSSTFNSPAKDYLKRIKLVQTVKEKVSSKSAGINGAIISIWFMNGKPGAVGYEKGRQIALEKITALHSAVKSGNMTMKQAGESIKKDTRLAQVDPSYKSNALSEFNNMPFNQQITFDPAFNKVIWQLREGEVSEVVTAKDRPLGNNDPASAIDALYHFGQVTKKVSSNIASFDNWLAEKQKLYVTIIY